MCGIAGRLDFRAPLTDLDSLRRMSRALAHRGPDDAGIVRVGPCSLVHRRLSIIDLSPRGHQPMVSADRRYFLSYNGEVYNYRELRRELESQGVRFRSETDTEVVLEALIRYGPEALSRFNGMWGLAFYDRDARCLLLSRDRLGIKPVFLHLNGDRLLFASEIKALLAAEPELCRPNLKNIARFLVRSNTAFLRESCFEGIEYLAPGTYLEVRERDGAPIERRERYWSYLPPSDPQPVDDHLLEEQLLEILVDSVRLRMHADAPVGTCLSGGLDSSSVVAITSRRLAKRPETFTAVYEQAGFFEAEYARAVVKDNGLVGHETHPDGADLPDVLEEVTRFHDSPTPGNGIYSQWKVMALAHGKVKVLLDGQGGDELFAGYHSDLPLYVNVLLKKIRRGDRLALAELLLAVPRVRELMGTRAFLTQFQRPGFEWSRAQLGHLPGFLSRRSIRALGRVNQALTPRQTPYLPLIADELLAHYPERNEDQASRTVTEDRINNLLWEQLTVTSIPALLQYEDRNSMAFSIEARVPFLDYRLVEFAFNMASAPKMRRGEPKAVLRSAVSKLLPRKVVDRRDKMGYATPVSLWLRGPHKTWMQDILLGESARARGFLRVDAVEQRIDQHVRGERDWSVLLHQLITLELFHRHFFDAPYRPFQPRQDVVGDSVSIETEPESP